MSFDETATAGNEQKMEAAPPAEESGAVAVVEEPAAPSRAYPRMMDSSNSSELSTTPNDEGDVPLPALLRPDGMTPSAYEERSRKFDSAFTPLTELSADDVVVGCASHGSELVAQSRDHLQKFTTHIRNVDTSQGAQSALMSLEAGQLVELPVAATKACLGTGFYGVAASARFGPKIINLCKQKAMEWHLADKTRVVVNVVAEKTTIGLKKTAEGVKTAWSWIKSKVSEYYSSAPPDGESAVITGDAMERLGIEEEDVDV